MLSIPEVYEARRKKAWRACIAHGALAAVSAVCWGVMIHRADGLCVIPALATGLNVFLSIADADNAREMKKLQKRAENMIPCWQKLIDDAVKRCAEEDAPAYTAPKRGKIFYLATKHRKARVRKKNTKRLKRGDGQ